MYWQQRFNRKNPDEELEQLILQIRKEHKDFGYRRIYGKLQKQGIAVNHKKVQRIVQKLGVQVTSFTRKSRKSHIKVRWVRSHQTGFVVDLARVFHIKRSLQILLNLSITRLMKKEEWQ